MFYRWALALYVAIIFMMLLYSLSVLIFDKKHDMNLFFRRVGFSFLWPLAIITKQGRNVMFGGNEK
jgi:hypothetical protein